MKNIDETIRNELQVLTPCPVWSEGCVTGRAISRERCGDSCSIYGCHIATEHSAHHRIYTQLSVNGDLRYRKEINGRINREVFSGRYQYQRKE
jgi:hypothetical protein